MIRMLMAAGLAAVALLAAPGWLERHGIPRERLEAAWRLAGERVVTLVTSLRDATRPGTARVRTQEQGAVRGAAVEPVPRVAVLAEAKGPDASRGFAAQVVAPAQQAPPSEDDPALGAAVTEVWRDTFEPAVAGDDAEARDAWGSDWSAAEESGVESLAPSGDRNADAAVAVPRSQPLAGAMSPDERSRLIRRMLAVHARLGAPLERSVRPSR